jgi:predicted TIM-barrel fold metal-dependent hydrolase
MIIDAHGHAFPPMGGPSGFKNTKDHMRYIQHGMMFHHQPFRRMDDGSEYKGPNPLYDGKDMTLEGLTEVNFRGGGFGKFSWTIDETDFSIQYLSPTLTNLNAPPELMIAQMDFIGVDKAVLHNGHSYGRLNEYLADCVKRYPERFKALALIDEWKADDPNELLTLDHAIHNLGLHALWFQSGNLRIHNRSETVDNPIFYPFWDHVRELGIPVFWFVTPSIPGKEPYLEELRAFHRWNERYQDIPVMFTHGIPLFRFMDGDKISIPEEVWKILAAPNLIIELLIPIFQGAIWEYPYVESQSIIEEYLERFGADRLAWGSDMPNVERNCTYRQCLDYLKLSCDFISQVDMDKICGDNVAKLMKW